MPVIQQHDILPVSNLKTLVSQQVPDHPVVSPSSGAIFERRIIEKYITENGVDPISGKEMTIDELIEVKSNNHPKFSCIVTYYKNFSTTCC